MNRTSIVFCVLALALALSVFYVIQARTAPNVTMVCGTLPDNSTSWTLANSPYEVCNGGVTVDVNKTLTIDPGVTVQFDAGSGSKLYVIGTLNAIGSPTQPITLTGTTTTPGSWGGISAVGNVSNPSVINLDHVTLEYGGFGTLGQITADRATLSIQRSLIRNGGANGVTATHNTQYDIQNTSFVGNAQDAILLNTPAFDLLMTGLTASGNGTNGVHISGATDWPGLRRWTDPGIPYFIDGSMGNSPGDVLTIDPGSELRFGTNSYFNIGGELKSQGTADAPILMTGQTQTSGSWRGIYANGGTHMAAVQLDYTTIEYAGSELADIELQFGLLIAHHSIIRNSSKDGIRFDNNFSGSILNSQIYGNAGYGIRSFQTNVSVLATNNWWGDAGGPQSDVVQCTSGLGDHVTAGVLFVPVLTSADSSVTVPLSNAPSLTLTPRRWFAPADGTTRVNFDITLRDGNGFPLPGRTVKLSSTLGNVVDGGVTDAFGKTLAYLTSSTPGDASVSARLDGLTACEGALSPSSTVTFTPPVAEIDLMPNTASPYQDGDITVSPLPVLTGVTTTITARLTNPLTSTVTVDVEFDFAQAGIGLAFGPIKTYHSQVIPPKGTISLSAGFIPSVAGHYCVQVNYSVIAIGAQILGPQAVGGDPGRQLNLNVYHPSTGSSDKNNNLDKTRNSLKNVNRFVSATYRPNPFAVPLAVANQGIAWDLNTAEKISNALNGDPPRQDFRIIDTPHVLSLPPVQPGDGLSTARADALNAVNDALAQANAYGTAAALALDRSDGASQAQDLDWASIQTGVMLEYNQLMGTELITASQKIVDLINVAASEGVTSVMISPSDVISMQQGLASGFSPQQIADAHTVGLTDADIESIRQSILLANPQDLAGDVIANMQQISQDLYSLGLVLAHPAVFSPGFSVTGGLAPVQTQASGNVMAQIYNLVTTVQLANPNSTPSLVNLRVRRIDLPADWTVDISPAQISLAPHEQTTVTVSIIAGSPLAQGSRPSIAVEGYIGSQLIGGVTLEVVVPTYQPFDGSFHVYMPMAAR